MFNPINGTSVPQSCDSPARSTIVTPTVKLDRNPQHVDEPLSWFDKFSPTSKRLDSSKISSVSLYHSEGIGWSITFGRGNDYLRTYKPKGDNGIKLRRMLSLVVAHLVKNRLAIVEPDPDGWFCYIPLKSSVYPPPASQSKTQQGV